MAKSERQELAFKDKLIISIPVDSTSLRAPFTLAMGSILCLRLVRVLLHMDSLEKRLSLAIPRIYFFLSGFFLSLRLWFPNMTWTFTIVRKATSKHELYISFPSFPSNLFDNVFLAFPPHLVRSSSSADDNGSFIALNNLLPIL